MFLPSAFLATRALLASMIGSGNSTLAARDEVSSFAEFFDLTGEAGVVSSDMCDIASITVDFDGQTVTFYNPVESQLNLESWAQGFANNQTVVY
ncbi:hypothetical protein N7510_005232 [Penicillium lagena]|uniref:uncharacterized protein n=1 Tax=Penicillium lagena TaxID=94218 RepID=UPI0025420CD1|nr:uncharacterized protein N7510_005232 [Penicillium lagena]KAJ5612038.1 hypothetical protein N7510_005232 [Penicillium lagena]